MALIEVKSEIAGNVWKVLAKPGDRIAADEPIVILESMKMEIPVAPSEDATVREVLVREGEMIAEGAVIARVEI